MSYDNIIDADSNGEPFMSALRILILFIFFVAIPSRSAAEDDWSLVFEESFDTPLKLSDRQQFGKSGWLTARLRGDGARITIVNGAAHFETLDFKDSALIRLTKALPAEYRLRVKVGKVDYDIGNYEHPADFKDPAFKYEWPRYIENGFYWLALTDRQIQQDSGEEFWHRFRKLGIDSDDHVGVAKPVYLAYMNPDPDSRFNREKPKPLWIRGVPGMLRCWDGKKWRTERWNWEPAFHYVENKWYQVEIEKLVKGVVLRAFDDKGALLPGMETARIALSKVYGMSAGKAGREEW
ncbi:MAG: hypothetical protein QF473_19745, partial [Planctomycetota bacterium]|nr:hypothetical protein [Planctomycetota bacterium]